MGRDKIESDAIPCLFFPSPSKNSNVLDINNQYLLYSHGNACDLGHIHKDMVRFAKNFKVHRGTFENQLPLAQYCLDFLLNHF